jgi:hypothetical protein
MLGRLPDKVDAVDDEDDWLDDAFCGVLALVGRMVDEVGAGAGVAHDASIPRIKMQIIFLIVISPLQTHPMVFDLRCGSRSIRFNNNEMNGRLERCKMIVNAKTCDASLEMRRTLFYRV